jgi:hypothetical protein
MQRGVRRLIGWGLALVLGTAGLLQAAAPACGHHQVPATRDASPSSEHHAHRAQPADAEHAHHTAAPATADASSPAPHDSHAPSPCDCVDDCCATALVAWRAPTSAVDATVVALVGTRTDAPDGRTPVLLRIHRQPPATPPPASRDA